jgi:hypothetical protein
MGIKDKVEVSKTRHCPPHYLPHKLPFGNKVVMEPCHYHIAKWRMAHHKFFCKFLGCKNYKFMISKYDKIKK